MKLYVPIYHKLQLDIAALCTFYFSKNYIPRLTDALLFAHIRFLSYSCDKFILQTTT